MNGFTHDDLMMLRILGASDVVVCIRDTGGDRQDQIGVDVKWFRSMADRLAVMGVQ